MPQLKDGQQLGSWTVHSFIAEGGNGEVWRASESQSNQPDFALKFLKNRQVDSVAYQRFKREVAAVQRLAANDGVLPIVEAQLPESLSKHDRAWYVMPFAISLEAHLQGASVATVVETIAEVAETLAAVHAAGIRHRDLKPGNLLWLNGSPKIGDFGLVSLPDQESIVEPGRVPGSLGYISNEMMVDPQTADSAATDVFALAKTLWKLLVPTALFPPQGPLLADGGPASLSRALTASGADALDRVIEAATRPEATRSSMERFAAELRAWLSLPTQAPLPDEVARSIEAAKASMAATVSERDRTAVTRRTFEQAQKTLVAQAKPLVEAIRAIDASGAIVGPTAILRDHRALVEQTSGMDGRVYGSTFHHGVRITRRPMPYVEEHLYLAFGIQLIDDNEAAVAASAYVGEERTLSPGYSWYLPPTEHPLGVELDAAIARVVNDAAAQLSDVMSYFSFRA